MNQNTILPDDPRLTAYALNEMEPVERAEFENLLQQDVAAQQAVEEIRATTALLATALEQEPDLTSATPSQTAQQAAIIPGGDLRKLDGGPSKKPFRLLRFPQFYYAVSGLAAACFAVFFVYWQQNQPVYESKNYTEVTLAAPAQRNDEKKAKVAAEGGAVNLPVAEPAVASLEKKEETLKLDAFVVAAPAAKGVAARSRAAGASAVGMITAGGMENPGRQNLLMRAKDFNTEAYSLRQDNDYLRVADQPVSTFSADVDTASYSNVRRFLKQGQRPPADAVRIEELVNYFPYTYPQPTGNVPFTASLEVASAPWAPEHRLVRIGLRGREVSDAARPAANLVFLLDVSGSMNEPNKLPLVKQSLRLLVGKLRPDDRVAIAVYAGASGLALPSTSAANKTVILDAIDRLQAEGSTNGEAGIQLAYDIAKANLIQGGVNRVILATDGDFNVGVTSEGELLRLVGEKAKSGVFLTVLGFGMGNLKDSQLEQLADKGNGNYAYIDSLAEAKKSLVEQAGGTLVTIAKDVKLQVEFNPVQVQAYRLIGYENRLLAREDFNNDKVDAGEIGAGHTVTALYEVVPVGVAMPGATPAVDALKYQKTDASGQRSENSSEMLTVKIRYKEPAGEVSSLLEFPLHDAGQRFEAASQDFKFAAAVAAFGMVLRASPHKGAATLPAVAAWGQAGLGSDAGGYRNEFISLVKQAQQLMQ
jgi:Ca-activated chloride channel family protein